MTTYIVTLFLIVVVAVAMFLLVGCAGLASTGAILDGMSNPRPYYYQPAQPAFVDLNERHFIICTNNGSTVFCRQ